MADFLRVPATIARFGSTVTLVMCVAKLTAPHVKRALRESAHAKKTVTPPMKLCRVFTLLHETRWGHHTGDKAWKTSSAHLRCVPPHSQTISQKGPRCIQTLRPDGLQDTDTGSKRNCSPARSARERKKRRDHILLGSPQHNVTVYGRFLCSQKNGPREIHLPLDRQMDAGYGSHRLRHLCRGVRADAGNRQIWRTA